MTAPNRVAALDLGMQTVTLAVFERAGEGLNLTACARRELIADPAADASRAGQLRIALMEIKSELKWTGGSSACAIPSQGVFTRFVKIPKVDPDKVGQMLFFEAQQNVPYPIEDVSWDYQVLPESDEDKLGALMVATKLDQLEATVEALTAAGFPPDLIETSPVSLYNAFRYNYPDQHGCSLLIDIGSRATNLIFAEGEQLFIRTLPVGGNSITTALQKRFQDAPFAEVERLKKAEGFIPPPGNYAGATSEEAAEMGKTARTVMTRIHNEITRSITFYRTNQGGSAPMRVFLAGGGASLPYTLEFFNEKLSLPIEFFNPLRRIGVGPSVDSQSLPSLAHSLGECTGLAVRQLVGDCPLEVGFKAPSLEKATVDRARRPFLVAAAALLIATLLVAGLYYSHAARQVAALNTSITAQTEKLGGFKNQLDRITGERRKLLNEAADLAALPMLRTAWATVLNEMNGLLPDRNIWITRLRPVVGEEVLQPGDGKGGWTMPAEARAGDSPDTEAPAITGLLIDGLYLESDEGPAVVDRFIDALRESPQFDSSAEVRLRATQSGAAWAYDYQLFVPLARPIPL